MDAHVTPTTQFAESNIGNGTTVALVVLDERPSKDLGMRAPAGAKISMTQDFAATMQETVTDGLRAKGFVVKPGVVADAANLRLEIRSLDYDVEVGFWSGGVNITTSMKARADGLTEEYEKFYRAASEDRAVFYPDAKKNSESITAVVDDMLRQFFEDGKLLNVLAADKPMAAMPPLGR